MRSASNMASNENYSSPNQYFKRMTDIKNADFLAISEHLKGRPAASLMSSE